MSTEENELKKKILELEAENARLKALKGPMPLREMKAQVLLKVGYDGYHNKYGNVSRKEMEAIHAWVMSK